MSSAPNNSIKFGNMATADQLASLLPLEFEPAKIVGNKGLRVYPLKTPLSMKLSDVCDCDIPFPPGVFNGRGHEERVNICFTISDEWLDVMRRIEADCCKIVGESTWASSIKDNEGYKPLIKCKLQLVGEKAVKYYDIDGVSTSPPPSWNRVSCNAVIQIRGMYSAGTSTGLQLDCTHVQYDTKQELSPF